MSNTVQFQAQLNYKQVAQLASQLSAADKRRLARALQKEAEQELTSQAESKLTPLQRKTVANVRQGFKELKLVQEGKLQARPLSDLLDEV